MGNANHIIEKVLMEVNTNDVQTANSVKNKISKFLHNDLLPNLEQLFDTYNSSESIVRFDQLNFNITIEKWDNYQNIKFQICNEIEKQLKNKINGDFYSKPDLISNLNFGKTGVKFISPIENMQNSFLFFIENGHFPWYANEEQLHRFLKNENWQTSFKNAAFTTKLKILLQENNTIIERFILQFPDKIILAFLHIINPEIKKIRANTIRIFSQSNPKIRLQFFKVLFFISLKKENKSCVEQLKHLHSQIQQNSKYLDGKSTNSVLTELNEFLTKIVPAEIRKDPTILSLLIPGFETHSQINKGIKSNRTETSNQSDSAETTEFNTSKLAEAESANQQTDLDEIQVKNNSSELQKPDETKDLNRENTNAEYADKKEITKQKQEQEQINITEKNAAIEKEFSLQKSSFFEKEKDEIAVENAGLVLLHPFINQFFKQLKIVDEKHNKTIATNKRDLAVQTLHFVATGKENVFEGNLIFEKFLCGIPLKTPVQKQNLLTDEIKMEAKNLLEAVIKNWPALKNTSPEGLRQMFIQRKGKIIQKEDNYKLIVESKVQDILLQKLNWNISLIKLPWFNKILFTEWQ